MKYLNTVNSPEDVKKIKKSQLHYLCDEVRGALIQKLSDTGGHVGSNLGVVELTVALHYVFNSPKDKIVWDVSHQSYVHKMLTGRKNAYINPECYKSVTGFTNPKESKHDLFTVGHTATSVSLALGLAKGRDAAGNDDSIIAIIGDGSLSGGQALEGLNYAGEYGKNLIIIINDNQQSVAENHGGLYKNLKDLRQSNGECEHNIFKSFGLDYKYVGNGHDVIKLVEVFEGVKNVDHPIVLHINTTKGKGLEYAQNDREEWHSSGPFYIDNGVPKNGYPKYDTTVYDSLIELLNNDKSSIVLTAGTPRALGFVGEQRKIWELSGRFVDVGIAEENAMGMSSGIAAYGANAVFGVYAPFLQRTYDQISHDLCLNNNAATILVLLPGAYGMKSNTHLGICDIPMITHIPNLVYLAPATRQEYIRMFKYATSQNEHPVAIRVPVKFVDGGEDFQDYSLLNKSKIIQKGKDIAIIAVGAMIFKANDIANQYKINYGKDLTIINPIFLTGTDDELLESLMQDHSLVITLEDGEKDGGYGEKIASFYGDKPILVKNFGVSKAFHSDFDADELLKQNGISVEGILDFISENLAKN